VSAAVTVDNLCVVRGGRDVLRDFSVDIARGSVTGLLGPSGSGKSTLMRSIVGVQQVAGGSIEVLGLPAGDRRLRARVGYMTQELSVYLDLTVRENLRAFAALAGAGDGRIERVVDQADLRDVVDRQAQNLSGGQQARVSLAIALLPAPELLVLDEPTVGLDPLLRRRLWQLFRDLAAVGRTLIVSSHVMDEAARCDTLILLRDGDVLAVEPPQTLLDRTGSADLESAFVSLIEDRSAS
jgi:ABC-2 type transport system ATP-binding protein